MLSRFHPNVKSTIVFLKLLKIKVNSSTVDDTLQNHKDWPSLLSIHDSLNKWKVENVAGEINPSDISLLPTPFIVFIKDSETPFEIVTEANDRTVSVLSGTYRKIKVENIKTFFKRWNGIFLIAEKGPDSGEKRFEQNRIRSFVKTLVPIFFFTGILILSILCLVSKINISDVFYPILGIGVQYLILLLGIFTSVLLIWHEIGSNNPILHKLCRGISRGNCDAILTSKYSKIFSWLSWSEVGLFYFVGGMCTLLFVNPIKESVSFIGYMNILALPYILFSVCYQWRIAKQWCVLCLIVQVLLLLGGANIIINKLLIPITQFSFQLIAYTFLAYALPALLWHMIKPYLYKIQIAKNTHKQYLNLKFNPDVYKILLSNQRQICYSVEELGISLGNIQAKNELVKVCNPYCEPCASTHLIIDELMDRILNLKLKIIFTTPNDFDHPAFQPTAHLMALFRQRKDTDLLKKALDDWYSTGKKDYKQFAAKFPLTNSSLNDQYNDIEAMYQWCKSMKITYTPTIFINGYELPSDYNIQDLYYFLSEE